MVINRLDKDINARVSQVILVRLKWLVVIVKKCAFRQGARKPKHKRMQDKQLLRRNYSTDVMKETAIMLYASVAANDVIQEEPSLSQTSPLLSLRMVSSKRTDSGASAELLMRLLATSELAISGMMGLMDLQRTSCEQELGSVCGFQLITEGSRQPMLPQLTSIGMLLFKTRP
jgi:hypothetical protein